MKKVVQSVLAWVFPLIAVFVLGPIAAAPVAGLQASDGTGNTTLLVSETPVNGVIALLVVVVVAGVSAVVVSKVTTSVVARHTASFVVLWAVLKSGNIRLLLMQEGSSAIVPLVIESLLVAIAGVVLFLCVWAGNPGIGASVKALKSGLTRRAGIITFVVATVASLVGGFLVAVSGFPGQGAFAGFLAGMLGGAVGKVVAQVVGDKDPDPVCMIAPLAAGVIAPLTLFVFTGGDSLADAARTGTLSGLGAIQPIAWLLATLAGAPVGIAWAASSAERADPKSRAATA